MESAELMRRQVICVAALVLSFAATNVAANGLPSCYSLIKMEQPKVEAEVFIAIDQTTPLGDLQQAVADSLLPFIKAGNAFSIFQFSAFTQGHYAKKVATVSLDALLGQEARNTVNKTILTKFDSCLKHQPNQAGKIAVEALKTSFGGASNTIAKSDVLGSLRDISSAIRQSTAKRKVLIVASDMLENSSITSFYSNGALRKIDPEKEMKLANENRTMGDFGGASIYVIGAGLLNTDKRNGYRDPKSLTALSDFWKNWFSKSNGILVEFGTPALLNPVR